MNLLVSFRYLAFTVLINDEILMAHLGGQTDFVKPLHINSKDPVARKIFLTKSGKRKKAPSQRLSPLWGQV